MGDVKLQQDAREKVKAILNKYDKYEVKASEPVPYVQGFERAMQNPIDSNLNDDDWKLDNLNDEASKKVREIVLAKYVLYSVKQAIKQSSQMAAIGRQTELEEALMQVVKHKGGFIYASCCTTLSESTIGKYYNIVMIILAHYFGFITDEDYQKYKEHFPVGARTRRRKVKDPPSFEDMRKKRKR